MHGSNHWRVRFWFQMLANTSIAGLCCSIFLYVTVFFIPVGELSITFSAFCCFSLICGLAYFCEALYQDDFLYVLCYYLINVVLFLMSGFLFYMFCDYHFGELYYLINEVLFHMSCFLFYMLRDYSLGELCCIFLTHMSCNALHHRCCFLFGNVLPIISINELQLQN